MMKPNTGGRLLKSQREPIETRRGTTSNAEKSYCCLSFKATSLMQALSLKCLIIQTFEFEVPDYSDESRESRG